MKLVQTIDNTGRTVEFSMPPGYKWITHWSKASHPSPMVKDFLVKQENLVPTSWSVGDVVAAAERIGMGKTNQTLKMLVVHGYQEIIWGFRWGRLDEDTRTEYEVQADK